MSTVTRLALALPVALGFSLFAPARAQEVTATPLGEYLVRFRHLEGHDFAPGGDTNFVRQRARLGLRFAYGDEVQTLVQLQDVRTWGEETDTLGDFSGDGIDMHQAYVDVLLEPEWRLRIGRQEISYLNHRLIGNASFTEQARSFDAIRLMARAFDQALAIDVFYSHVLDTLPAASQAADDLFAWAFRLQLGEYFQPALIGVVDLSSGTDRVRATNGLLLQSEWPFGLKISLEGYLQNGGATAGAVDVDYLAWMFATRLRFTLVDLDLAPFLEAFVETLSGDDDPNDEHITTFDTLFATNHRYYGESDFFLNIPTDTAQRGLLDAGLVLGVRTEDDLFAQVAFHLFQTMESRGGPSSFGQELDVTAGAKLNEHLSFDLNYSVFLPGNALTGDGDAEHFVYSTLAASY